MENLQENVDYQLVPVDESANDSAWQVRILTGDYIETIIRFGSVRFDGKNDCLKFDFTVVYSPDDYDSSEEHMQIFAGDVLASILERAAKDGSLVQKTIDE